MSSRLLKPLFSNKRQQQPQTESLDKIYQFKTRFATIGTVGSGKTTVSTLLVITSQTMSHLLPEFSCMTLPGSTNIVNYDSKMRSGHFPPKTDPSSSGRHEAGLLLRWGKRIGNARQMNIPICDLAGEKLQSMIHSIEHRLHDPTSQEAFNINTNILNYVRNCEGYILIMPASRAMAFRDGLQLEKETEDEDKSGISNDPDSNLYLFMQNILSEKQRCKGKPIKAIACVITKWDILMPFAQEMGIDIDDPSGEGIQNFMETLFPQTTSLLKFIQKNNSNINLRFFPSYVKIQKNSTTGNAEFWPDGSQKIEMEENQRIPKYWAQSYVDLIHFLGTFAS